jgi:hypothetical protein
VDLAVKRYLHVADRLLPSRITGFYVVGSTALGAFRVDRSDIDFVAVVDRPLRGAELGRLRLVHALTAGRSVLRALSRGRVSLPGTCNGVFVDVDDLTEPVSAIRPVASHTGHEFGAGRGFDVNPVVWKVLAERGIAVRGPAADTLGLQPEPERLRPWNLDNLDTYWRRWAEQASSSRPGMGMRHPRWPASWGALGAPRLHCTVATGEVISKEAAGEYALDTFDEQWHPIIREALAYWRGQPAIAAFPTARSRTRQAAHFVQEVVTAAHTL